jgi:iron-sulfur cluster assembly protein
MSSEEGTIVKHEIFITPEAAEQIQLIRRENQVPETRGLRIGIQSGGCCGISYMLAFDEKSEATDKVFLSEGVSVYIDEEIIDQLSGTTLEYVESPQGKGFRFNNPNQVNSCGCGDAADEEKSCGCGEGGCGDHE